MICIPRFHMNSVFFFFIPSFYSYFCTSTKEEEFVSLVFTWILYFFPFLTSFYSYLSTRFPHPPTHPPTRVSTNTFPSVFSLSLEIHLFTKSLIRVFLHRGAAARGGYLYAQGFLSFAPNMKRTRNVLFPVSGCPLVRPLSVRGSVRWWRPEMENIKRKSKQEKK